MLGNVEERKPAAIRSREVVGCFDDDLNCLIDGIHLNLNLRIFEIYLISTAIRAANYGLWHVSGRLPHGFSSYCGKDKPDPRRSGPTDASNRWIFEIKAFSIANARMSQLCEGLAVVAHSQNTD